MTTTNNFTDKISNEETAAAIEEGRKLAYDKSVKGYKSMEELKEALDL